MPTKRHLIAIAFFASLLLALLAFSQRNHFPRTMTLVPAIAQAPAQAPVAQAPFTVTAHGRDYLVKPLFDYDLTGLVVSYKRFHPGIGLHKRWNDYINVADVCVVWGKNASELDLNRFRFWNGEFTCNSSTRNQAAWQQFNPDELSNNHLVTEEPWIRRSIKQLRVGDQIRISGQLAAYGQPGGPMRGTSTTRTDRGNGACETIYLDNVRLLRRMHNGWRSLFWLSILGLGASVIWWFRTPYAELIGD